MVEGDANLPAAAEMLVLTWVESHNLHSIDNAKTGKYYDNGHQKKQQPEGKAITGEHQVNLYYKFVILFIIEVTY